MGILKTSIAAPGIGDGQGITTITQAASSNPLWLYFLVGAMVATFIITIINWRKL